MPTTTRRGIIYEGKFMADVNGSNALIIVRLISKAARLFPLTSIVSINDDKERLPKGAFKVRTVDNDEDPFTTIKAKTAVFKFFASSNINIATFMSGGSDEWQLVAYTSAVDDANIFFNGYLVLDTASEPLEPFPYVVTLTATDNLGLLKNKPLVDFDGANPTGDNKIIKYIAWALNRTGLQLPIYVNNNLFEEHSPDIPFYESCFLQAKTFERELTSAGAVSEDCYTVLQKILGNDSRIFQLNGAWWIERIYEKYDVANTVHQFDYDGTYVGAAAPTFYLQAIEQRSDIDFINDNAQVTIESPYNDVTLRYKYDYPREIVDNIDFSRGALIDFNPATGIAKYEVADWLLFKQTVGGVLGEAYIHRLFQDSNRTYEKERYLVIDANSSSPTTNWLKSNPVPINKEDKIELSFDVRFGSDYSGSGDLFRFVGLLVLEGFDGTTWFCGHSDPNAEKDHWELVNATLPLYLLTGTASIWTFQKKEDDQTKWANVSCSTPPAPVGGNVFVYLVNHQDPTIPRHFSNLQFNYIPFINGAYSKYAGQTNTVTQSSEGLSNSLENDMSISDAPAPLMKGAIKYFDGTQYVLAGRFYDGRSFPGGVPADEFLHSFGNQLVVAMWQQYRRFIRNIETDLQSLKSFSPPLIPDFHKQYLFTIPHPHLTNKYFMLLKYEQDFDSQIWKAFLWECYDTVNGLWFQDPYTFKYITG